MKKFYTIRPIINPLFLNNKVKFLAKTTLNKIAKVDITQDMLTLKIEDTAIAKQFKTIYKSANDKEIKEAGKKIIANWKQKFL